ncbi:MAG: beta-3-deoxy-D-manno-oct-2-ulosonic acid transferase [Pseudomonadota bacterium]
MKTARSDEPAANPAILARTCDPVEARKAFETTGAGLILSPEKAPVPIDPWSLLPKAERLIAHGDDDWIALAAILDVSVHALSAGRYAAPGDTRETLKERAFQALLQPFQDPFGSGWLAPEQAIRVLSEWRAVIEGNRGAPGERIVAACGMSWWKREEIRRFLWSPGAPLMIHRSASRALDTAARQGGSLAVWPSRISPDLKEKAKRKGVNLVRVEDGFVRSVGLGSNLVPPLSVIVDRKGIHYDPSHESDLETILANARFSPEITARAAGLRETIVAARISKYAAGKAPRSQSPPRPAHAKRIVLVPGQVEDDLSVLSGGGGLTSNLELLRRTRAMEPDACIWWRPHPDVDAGHRKGAVDDAAALEVADRIVREGSMSDLLDQVDALHTLTSLSGFEALLRGTDVTCHGVPFYSGWGLTRDLGSVPKRRGRVLSLDELVAGVLLLYPRYLDPVTGLPCPPETLVQRLTAGEASNRLGWVEPLRRFQGRITRLLRAAPRKGAAQ